VNKSEGLTMSLQFLLIHIRGGTILELVQLLPQLRLSK
jgi:hypothetical protein